MATVERGHGHRSGAQALTARQVANHAEQASGELNSDPDLPGDEYRSA